MKGVATKDIAARMSPQVAASLVAGLGLAFVVIILVPGFQLATVLVNTTAALQFTSDQRRYPEQIRLSLEAVRDRLATRGYVQAPLDQLHEAVARLDAAEQEIAKAQPAGWFDAANGAAALREPETRNQVAALRESWHSAREALVPVLNFTGVPYQDDEATGAGLNEDGRRLVRDVGAALRAAHRPLPAMDATLAAMQSGLQARNARAASKLRLVMIAGFGLAAASILLVALLLNARRRQAENLRRARQQTDDILRTVTEGLFLLDQQLVIGPTYSTAMERLFQRKDLAGLPFADLLRDVVSEKTLATALKFVGVLWAERTNENLVKSINPLGEVEVHIGNAQGKPDTRYLAFDFHRVRVDGSIAQLLVSVSDVTARVELARELTTSQNQAQAQVDTLLGILQVDPAQLASFLNDSNAAMKMINAVFREPARDEAAFRKKLDTLFRQAHSVKGEAASLGLSSIESRAHAFEDDLKALREKGELSGNDFLPLVIKLDDLLTHLQSIGDLVGRLSRLHGPAPARIEPEEQTVGETTVDVAEEQSDVVQLLRQLAARVATENQRQAEVQCTGFEKLPEQYRRLVKDVTVQAVRNSIVHGIEAPADRLAAGKPATGVVRVEFRDLAESGFKLTIEDDGQGLSAERIREVALRKGFITAEQAAALDPKQTFALLFQSGFSTVEHPTKDAGRGVGMNLMAELVHEAGGRLGVATKAGQFTRLSLTLPPSAKIPNAFEAA